MVAEPGNAAFTTSNSVTANSDETTKTSLRDEITAVTGNTDIMTQTTTATSTSDRDSSDPLNFGRHRRDNVTQRQMKIDHPKGDKKKLKKFYNKQNELIDQFLGADDEERLAVEEDARVAPRIKLAVNASFVVNFCLFVIQLYAAVSTGSLSVSRDIILNKQTPLTTTIALCYSC